MPYGWRTGPGIFRMPPLQRTGSRLLGTCVRGQQRGHRQIEHTILLCVVFIDLLSCWVLCNGEEFELKAVSDPIWVFGVVFLNLPQP